MLGEDDPLQNLRDIHLPMPISFWPLAPGWYWLIGVLLVGAVIFIFSYRFLKRSRFAALHQLRQLQIACDQKTAAATILSELSSLLRRIALLKHTRESVAGLNGTAWLKFLDTTGKTEVFTSTVGQLLISGPYQRQTEADITQLLIATEKWIRRNT
jgi:hypothetical protein